MKPLFGYLFLTVGILSGIASNSFAKISEGFTKLTPSFLCILFMYIVYVYYNVLYGKSYVSASRWTCLLNL